MSVTGSSKVFWNDTSESGPTSVPSSSHLVVERLDVDHAAHGVVEPALRDRPGVLERRVERRHAGMPSSVSHTSTSSSARGRHLEIVLLEDLLVVDDGCRHHRVRQHARASGVRRVLVDELLHLGQDAVGLGHVGEVAERAALHEARHLQVVVEQPEVGRIAAEEPGLQVRRRVEHDLDVVLRGVVLLDELPEVGDRLGLAEEEAHLLGAAAPSTPASALADEAEQRRAAATRRVDCRDENEARRRPFSHPSSGWRQFLRRLDLSRESTSLPAIMQ